jgi:hypothetical protein
MNSLRTRGTSTKNPAYRDVMYVEALIGPLPDFPGPSPKPRSPLQALVQARYRGGARFWYPEE